MVRMQLGDADVQEISALLRDASGRCSSVDDADLLLEVSVLAHELPVSVRRQLNRFRREEPGYCIISGHAVDQDALGPTPAHWNEHEYCQKTLQYGILPLLYGSLLGDAFGWATQQNGRLIHEVLPIRGQEHEQLGTSSEALLTWHTEDAFHPYRSDYVILFCLRNPYRAITTVCNVDDLELSPADVAVLCQERFSILPDESHKPTNNARPDVDFSHIHELMTAPPPIAVLFGGPGGPYLRCDPYFMQVADGDHEARRALDALITQVDGVMQDVVLEAGDLLVLDNYKVVHGRKPFKARFDGTDRWLKRICVTRDLRKSRDMRESELSQIIC